ncbi:HAD family hydrolase [Micromonospora sp. SH-82]|uniref:HAD family hydrolase n=1 Tax=Micromonospora sp. SH-82 TaxID=3132938 RepID=UPI003EC01DFB
MDGTLIPADLRWLRRAIARTHGLGEADVIFPDKKVHGYTDETIAIDSAIASGVPAAEAELSIPRFRRVLVEALLEGRHELAQAQPPYEGALNSITRLKKQGFVQTVLTGNLRRAAEVKLQTLGLAADLDLSIGGFGSDERDRLKLPEVVARRFAMKYGRPLIPGKTVVIGDAPNDIACARHAGFWVVVVTHRTTRGELSVHEPDAIIESLQPELLVAAISSLVRE